MSILDESSVAQTLRKSRLKIAVSQIAVSFIFAGLNWVVITWSTIEGIPKGPLEMSFWIGLFWILAWPVVLSVLGSMTFPERVIIAPLDVNLLTLGIFAVTLWYDVARSYYLPYLALGGSALIMLGLVQNQAARKIIGMEGSEEALSKRVYRTTASRTEVTNLVVSHPVRRALHLEYSHELEDGTLLLYGAEDVFSFCIGISRSPEPRDQGCIISVVGYEEDSYGIRKTDDSNSWFKGKCASILELLTKLKLECASENMLPPSLVENVLLPTKGWLDRFRETWNVLARPIVGGVVLGGATFWCWQSKLIDNDTAVFIAVTIALYLVGTTVASRRKRLR